MNQSWIQLLPAFLKDKVEGRLSLQKALGNTGWLIGDQIVRMGVGLLVGVWLARYLGPSLYGEFSYALAFTLLFTPIAGLGLESILIRRFVLDPQGRDDVIGAAFWLSFAGGMAVFTLATAGIHLLRPQDALVHWLVGITAAGAIPQAFIVIEYWFESQVQSKYYVCVKCGAFLVLCLVKIGLILAGAPVVAFAWAGLAEAVLAAAGLAAIYRWKGYALTSWRFRRSQAWQLLRESWPLILVAMMNMVSLRIDQVMLGEMVGSEEVGIYSAAVRLAEPWSFIAFAICTSVFPGIMATWSTDRELFHGQIQKLYNLMALIAYVVAIPMTFAAGWLVELLFGEAYARAGPLLAVLIWAGLFTNLAAARTLFLISMNWTRIFSLTLFMGCVMNVILNLLLIPSYGAMGAVVATIISYWFAQHGACFLFTPLRRTGWMLAKALIWPKPW